jgi:hypothetical protein
VEEKAYVGRRGCHLRSHSLAGQRGQAGGKVQHESETLTCGADGSCLSALVLASMA